MTKRKIGLPRASNVKKAYRSVIESEIPGSRIKVKNRQSGEFVVPEKELAFKSEMIDKRTPSRYLPRYIAC
jgi:hypothetical protein